MTKSHFDIGIRCKHLISMKNGDSEPQSDQFVGIRDGIIQEVSDWTPEKTKKCKELISGDHHVVMPGLINGHTHMAMTLFRGLEDDAPLQRWLFERIIPLEMQLVDSEFVRVGTDLAALECIRFGVTTVNEMYFFPETVAECFDRSGLRGLVGQSWASSVLPGDRILGSDRTAIFESFHEKYGKHDRISPTLAPHAPYSCDDALIREVVRLSEKHSARVHIHIAETQNEVKESLKKHHKTPVQRLNDLGILSPRTLGAHCVHLNDSDMEIMKNTGASVAYNPDSNLKLSSGIAPITKYRKLGIPVAFGTDGAASNNDLSLFGAMDLGTKLQKLYSGDNSAMTAHDSLQMATWEGARALGLQDQVGSLEVGKSADVILIDLNFPHLQPVLDVRSLLAYSVQGLEVDTVLCHGKILMRNKEVLTLDQEEIFASAARLSEKVRLATKKLK